MKTRKILSVLLAAAMVLTSGVFGITVHADRISGAPDDMPVLKSSGPYDDLWSAAESVGSKPVTGYRYLWNTGDDPENFGEVYFINDEGPEHLFGGIPGFWCTTSAENYVGIHAEPNHPVTVNGIVLVTAADSGEEGCENRAPDEWVLSGLNDQTDEWEFLAYGRADFVGNTNGKYYAASIEPTGAVYREFAFDMQGSAGAEVKTLAGVYVLSEDGANSPLLWDVDWENQALAEQHGVELSRQLLADSLELKLLNVEKHFAYGTGSYPGEGPENLWDGNLTTKFCTKCPQEFGVPAVSAVCLDEAYSVNGLMIATANDSFEYNGRLPQRWLLAGSNDGENWDVIVAGNQDFFWTGSHGEGEDAEYYVGDFTFIGTKFEATDPYRYFRFEADKADDDVFQFSEIVLCSDDAPDSEPFEEWMHNNGDHNGWYGQYETARFNGHTYYLNKATVTWNTANEHANNLGGYLAVVTSEEEEQFLKDWISSLNDKYFMGTNFWLGGVLEEGEWRWVNGEPFEYTDWNEGEPNNPDYEWYLGFLGLGWNDYSPYDSLLQGFIVEADYDGGWIEFSGQTRYQNGMAYDLYFGSLSFSEAQNAAEAMGGRLATIDSQEKQDIITDMILAADGQDSFWIGAEKAWENDGEVWRWIHSGEYFGYTNWAEGEPNNADNREGLVELYWDGDTVAWNDIYELAPFGFVVEYDSPIANSIERDGHSYFLMNGLCDWHDAKAFCESLGGHLMTVTSEDEANILRELTGGRQVWLGATDENSEGEWQWVSGEPFDYTEWIDGQPDNCGDGEHYLGSCNHDSRWNDFNVQSFDITGFACEFEPDAFPSYPNSGYEGKGELITGEVIGDLVGWDENPDVGAEAAFDGSPLTYFDPQDKGGDHYAGIKAGEPYTLTAVAVASRIGWSERLVGAEIQGSNDGENWTTLYRFHGHFWHPMEYVYITDDFDGFENNTGYSMYRYYNEENHGDTAEVEFYGTRGTAVGFEFASDPVVRPGDEFTMEISLAEPATLKAIMLSDFSVDEDVFEIVKGEWLDAGVITTQWDPKENTANIAFAEDKDMEGPVFVLTLKVRDDAPAGEYDVTCSVIARATFADGEEDVGATMIRSGRITVDTSDYIRGDMDNSGKVDSNDAIYLLRHIMIPSRYPIDQPGDVNGDGRTDSNDAIYLLRHVMLPQRYPLS